MQITTKKIYDLVRDITTEEEFEQKLQQLSDHYDALFDEQTCALLIIDELGRNKHSITSIQDLQLNNEYTIMGTITNISDSRTFQRKNGTEGRVINLDICDNTGSCKLVLWNDDIQQIEKKKISPGTTVKIINGHTKEGRYGIEIHLNRWSFLEVPEEKKNTIDEPKIKTIQGILIQKEPTRPFFKDTGEFGFVTTIRIQEDNSLQKTIILWDDKVKDIQKYKIGDTITIHGVQYKNNNGIIEYHVNGKSTIT
ncbi:MAG: OB-fold nucleic acid binding domain-containing protein [Candidatus Thermoplasmatota archaeon]